MKQDVKLFIHLSLRGAKRRSNPEKERWCTGLLRYARNDVEKMDCHDFSYSSVIARSEATKQSRERKRACTGLLCYARNDREQMDCHDFSYSSVIVGLDPTIFVSYLTIKQIVL